MANVSRPGFWPVGTISGSPWQGSVREFPIDTAANAIFIGDLVKIEDDGKANVISATTDLKILGACVGIKPVDPQALGTTTLALAGGTEVPLGVKYAAKGTARTIFVCTAPDAIYESDCEGTAERSNVGQTANVTLTTGNTTTGLSKQVTNLNPGGTAADWQLRIIDIPSRVDNTPGAANCHVHVIVNAHAYGTPSVAGV